VGHDVSILNRLAADGLRGRTASKVSTTIIRPPQHGQRGSKAGFGFSRAPTGGGQSDNAIDVVSRLRMRAMLRAPDCVCR